ncbi:hypothetical protein ROZALSC1DRAFT_21027, partial [Rozella allomycis CSF55]
MHFLLAAISLHYISAHTYPTYPAPYYTLGDIMGERMLPNNCTKNPVASIPNYSQENGANALVKYLHSKNLSLVNFAKAEAGCPVCGGTTKPDYMFGMPNKPITLDGRIHEGPCEIWIDDQLVYHNDQKCPFTIPINYSKCTKPKCLLNIILSATHLASKVEFFQFCLSIGTGKPDPVAPDGFWRGGATTAPSVRSSSQSNVATTAPNPDKSKPTSAGQISPSVPNAPNENAMGIESESESSPLETGATIGFQNAKSNAKNQIDSSSAETAKNTPPVAPNTNVSTHSLDQKTKSFICKIYAIIAPNKSCEDALKTIGVSSSPSDSTPSTPASSGSDASANNIPESSGSPDNSNPSNSGSGSHSSNVGKNVVDSTTPTVTGDVDSIMFKKSTIACLNPPIQQLGDYLTNEQWQIEKYK